MSAMYWSASPSSLADTATYRRRKSGRRSNASALLDGGKASTRDSSGALVTGSAIGL